MWKCQIVWWYHLSLLHIEDVFHSLLNHPKIGWNTFNKLQEFGILEKQVGGYGKIREFIYVNLFYILKCLGWNADGLSAFSDV